MKLVALMCVEEYVDDARKLLKEQKIAAYSEAPMKGFKIEDHDESQNWFASKHVPDNSHIFFTMCNDQTANELMAAIQTCSESKKIDSVHAFQLNIEKFIG